MHKKILMTIIVIAIVVGGLSLKYNSEKVTFLDPNFEVVIRETIGKSKGTITRADVYKITTLTAKARGIKSLDGIEYLTNLVNLDLEDNEIEDLFPMRDLLYLRSLNLNNNGIKDIEKINLVRLLNLEELYLGRNSISNIEELSNLSHLRILDISKNSQLDGNILALGSLVNLQYVDLSECNIIDLSPISYLTSLKYLNLSSNSNISSIETIGYLENLEVLIMKNVPVQDDVKSIENLRRLIKLDLKNTGITDITSLEILMERGILQDNKETGIIAYVDIGDNPIKDYKPIYKYWSNITYRNPLILP